MVLRETRHHNGTESRDLLPLWKEDREAIPSRRPVAVVLRETRHHNGTESRNLLPLWKEDGEAIPSREHVAVVLRETRHRNGTNAAPQRHRIAGFAAVVERGWRGNPVQKASSSGAAGNAAPQRHLERQSRPEGP